MTKLFVLHPTAMVLILFLLTGCSSQDVVNLSGTVEAAQYDVIAEVAGKIVQVNRAEGEILQKNDSIAEIDAGVYRLTVQQWEQIVRMKQAKWDELKRGTREEQIQQAEAAVSAAKAKVDEMQNGARQESIEGVKAQRDVAFSGFQTAKKNVDAAIINQNYWSEKYKKAMEQYERLEISQEEINDIKYKYDAAKEQTKTIQQQAETAQAQVRASDAQVDLLQNGNTKESVTAAKANYDQAVAQLRLLQQGATNEAIRAAEADWEQAKAQLQQTKLILDQHRILAPIEGTLMARHVEVGDMVNRGTNIGTISNPKDKWIKVFIPQKYMHKVKLNQESELFSTAFPDQIIKGKITYIASQAEFTPKNIQTDEEKENTVFAIKIKILDHVDALKPGMTLRTQFR